MKAMACKHMLADLHPKRLQQCAGLADPVRHGRAGKVDAFPCVNLGLAIERQVIAVFGDQDMGDQTGPRLAAFDGQRRHLGLDLRIAAFAGEARLDMAHDTKRGRDIVENLADALACADEV